MKPLLPKSFIYANDETKGGDIIVIIKTNEINLFILFLILKQKIPIETETIVVVMVAKIATKIELYKSLLCVFKKENPSKVNFPSLKNVKVKTFKKGNKIKVNKQKTRVNIIIASKNLKYLFITLIN